MRSITGISKMNSIQHPLNRRNSSNKLSKYEWLYVTMVGALPLQMYRAQFFISLSLDRILLIVTALLYISKLFTVVRWKLPHSIAACGFLSLAISTYTGRGLDAYALEFILSLFQGYTIYMISYSVIYNNRNSKKICFMIFSIWATIVITFSLYTLYYYYVKKVTNIPVPFLGYTGDYDLHKFQEMRGRRLFLPYAASPLLGGVTGFTSIFFLCSYLYTLRLKPLLMFMVLVGITILTLSRGAVLTLILSCAFLFVFGAYIKAVIIDRRIFGIILTAVIVFVGINAYHGIQENAGGLVSIDRLTIDVDKIQNGRHLQLRMYAFTLFAQGNIVQMLGGQGLGTFLKSNIGAYSFSSYLTLMVEVGIFGLFTFSLAVFNPIFHSWKHCYNGSVCKEIYFYTMSMALFIICIHLFYEQKSNQELWVALGIVTGLASTPSVILKQTFNNTV